MNWNVVAERTKLFAFIWGTMFFGAVSPAFLGIHGAYRAEIQVPRNVAEAVAGPFFVELTLCCFGVLPALLYAFLLGYYERDKTERQNKSLLVPLLICAVYELPFSVWLATGPGAVYGPDGWLNGGSRIGITGYVAALVAGYFVARQPSDKWTKRSKSSPLVYIIGAIAALWLISAMLFPTLQSVKA